MDDVLVSSKTWEGHMQALHKLFGRLVEVQLAAKPSKCQIGFTSLSFLGQVVGEGILKPEQDKVDKILSAAPPKTKKEVRAFLGLASYYRRFVSNFATLSTPLSDLTKKGKPDSVVWTDACDRSFSELKRQLGSHPVVMLPDLSKSFTLRTDASDVGLGAVLLQESGEGLKPVSYASRKLSSAESRYATIEKECLAVVWAVRKFEQFLYGQSFILETDHQPLAFLKQGRLTSNRLARWALILQEFDIRVKVIPGKENLGADFLSRSSV
jgi:hypothetical protein